MDSSEVHAPCHRALLEQAMNTEYTVTFKCEGCGVRKREDERYRPRSAFTVCSQLCLDKAAQQKMRALHDPRRRDLLGSA
jgi:hypothetical protein